MKNDIARSPNPEREAVKWYREEYSKNAERYLRGKFLSQGRLYLFDYKDPKYKKELAFFDTQPLVLSLGPVKTKLGTRVIGLNLHLLPPNVRRLVLYQIYYMFKARYSSNLYKNTQKDVPVSWKAIVKPLEKFGIGFCIRMYIPERQKNVVEFLQEDWAKAIWIPSAGYAKIGPRQLEAEWRKFVKENRRKTRLVSGESHNKPV